jgi:Ca-activated chloride channel family protein
MSFASPFVLVLGVVLLAVIATVYAVHQRRRARAAQAFSAPHLFASVTPRRPGWRRHIPMAAFALAVALLLVAAAKPQTTVAVPVEHASIMLMTDVSGSMEAQDVKPSRLVAARRAATTFVDGVPKKVNVGVIAFNQTATVLQSPTTDRIAVKSALQRMKSSGGTATGDAVRAAVRILSSAKGVDGKAPPSAIVLLSDGKSTKGVQPLTAAQEAGRRHIPIYTVALGTPQGTITVPRPGDAGGTETRQVPPDPQSLAEVAKASGGKTYTAADASKLSDVYKSLGSLLGTKNEKRQITAGFAGGALVLLLLGAAMSLRWFGRLI